MKPRYLGVAILIVNIILIIMLFQFNSNLNSKNLNACNDLCMLEGTSCSIESCPFNNENSSNSLILFMGLLIAFVGGIGFYLSLTKTEKLVEQKEYDLTKLNKEEKNVFLFIKKNNDNGTYQSNIVENFNFPKSKTSRTIDKLEQLDLVERKIIYPASATKTTPTRTKIISLVCFLILQSHPHNFG